MWVRGFQHTFIRPVRERLGVVGAVAAVISTVAVCVLPATSHSLSPISQDYSTPNPLPLGSIVSLEKDSSDRVDASTTSNVDYIIGVVISGDTSPLSLTSAGNNHVQVATTGVVPILVSNINGDVTVGDQITASPIAGVGMKATGNVKVVGIAQSDLASSSNTEKQSYTDKAGKKHEILLGEIQVLVNVAYYFKQPDRTIIPTAIQNVANALAGKTVNTLPIIISMVIFFVTLLVVVTLIYTMIHGSIISVGRNPMSQAAVYRNMIQLSGLVIIILGVAVVAIYLILTKL